MASKFHSLMAALVCVLVLRIMNVLVDVLLALMIVCVFMLVIRMATHLGSPPFSPLTSYFDNFDYKTLSHPFHRRINGDIKRK